MHWVRRSLSNGVSAIALMGSLLSCGNLPPIREPNGLLDFTVVDTTPISQLQKPQPTTTVVHLRGEVGDVAPLLAGGAYRLQDSSGSIWVLTTGALPQVGETLLIQGEVRYQSIPIAGQDLGESYVRETTRRP